MRTCTQSLYPGQDLVEIGIYIMVFDQCNTRQSDTQKVGIYKTIENEKNKLHNWT